jgi:hypothetical protein
VDKVCFLFYLTNYFVIILFNVALVSATNSLAGRHGTIDDGLGVAVAAKGYVLLARD